MSAIFLAKGTMTLERNERKASVIFGELIEGTIEKGMHVSIPFNPSLSMTCEVESVEYKDVKLGSESYIALVLTTEGEPEEEAELIMALNINNEELKVAYL